MQSVLLVSDVMCRPSKHWARIQWKARGNCQRMLRVRGLRSLCLINARLYAPNQDDDNLNCAHQGYITCRVLSYLLSQKKLKNSH